MGYCSSRYLPELAGVRDRLGIATRSIPGHIVKDGVRLCGRSVIIMKIAVAKSLHILSRVLNFSNTLLVLVK